MNEIEEDYSSLIAIIGLAGRFPAADNINKLWSNLLEGIESVTTISDAELLKQGLSLETIHAKNFVNKGIDLQDKKCFDRKFFGISSKEALLTDPQQRLLLECSYHALEDAGYIPSEKPLDASVFLATDPSTYYINYIQPYYQNADSATDVQLIYSNVGSASQVSFHLNLKGPSVNIYTACSSSLVCVHHACQSLLLYEAKLALAGGASVNCEDVTGYNFQQNSVYSSTGHCRAFDTDADGTIAGQGLGVIVLKRYEEALRDGDNIYAIIRGTAVNNDASQKVSYTAPSVEGQIEVIKKALQVSSVSPSNIGFVETHGTGTKIGDTIELTALNEVYGRKGTTAQPCYLSSIKSNIGHLNSAAGIAGLIKATLVLEKKVIPRSINFSSFNTNVDLDNSTLKITKKNLNWDVPENSSRMAAISSFGIGGTNAHVILQEPRSHSHIENEINESVNNLLVISAKSEKSLKKKIEELYTYLTNNPSLSIQKLAYTLNCYKGRYNFRQAFCATSLNDFILQLKKSLTYGAISNVAEKRQLVFIFPSDRNSELSMAYHNLYQTNNIFHKTMKLCDEIIYKELNFHCIELLYPIQSHIADAKEKLSCDFFIQPCIFALEYSLYKWLDDLGIKPNIVYGFSLGEYVAAAVAGVMSLDAALFLVCERAKLMEQVAGGLMLECMIDEKSATKYITNDCSIAFHVSDKILVFCASEDAIIQLEENLSSQGIYTRRIATSHPFHSVLMKKIANEFKQSLKQVELHTPKIRFCSSLYGCLISNEISEIEYWINLLSETIQASNAAKTLLADDSNIFLELGLSNSYASAILKLNSFTTQVKIIDAYDHESQQNYSEYYLLQQLWELGFSADFKKLYPTLGKKDRISLPLYPFEKTVYALDRIKNEFVIGAVENSKNESPLLEPVDKPENDLQKEILTIWQNILGSKSIGVNDNFFRLGGHSLIAVQILAKLHELFDIELSMEVFLHDPTIKGIEASMINSQLLITQEEELE